MSGDDEVYPPAHDLSAYRRARQQHGDQALILMFAEVLGQPLTRRSLTPEEQARREDRLRTRREYRVQVQERRPRPV